MKWSFLRRGGSHHRIVFKPRWAHIYVIHHAKWKLPRTTHWQRAKKRCAKAALWQHKFRAKCTQNDNGLFDWYSCWIETKGIRRVLLHLKISNSSSSSPSLNKSIAQNLQLIEIFVQDVSLDTFDPTPHAPHSNEIPENMNWKTNKPN